MRPTPGESLQAIRRVLQGVVAPHVGDPYAATQLDHILRALDDLARCWADEALWLIESNAIVESLLQDVMHAIEDGSAPPVPDSLLRELSDILHGTGATAAPDSVPRYDQLAARSDTLRETLSQVVATGLLERSTAPVAQRIRQYLRDHVARLS